MTDVLTPVTAPEEQTAIEHAWHAQPLSMSEFAVPVWHNGRKVGFSIRSGRAQSKGKRVRGAAKKLRWGDRDARRMSEVQGNARRVMKVTCKAKGCGQIAAEWRHVIGNKVAWMVLPADEWALAKRLHPDGPDLWTRPRGWLVNRQATASEEHSWTDAYRDYWVGTAIVTCSCGRILPPMSLQKIRDQLDPPPYHCSDTCDRWHKDTETKTISVAA